jgi:hypothetical protein
VTNIVFGNYEFVEACASADESPLDTDYREFDDFDAKQMAGFSRASLAFLESYLRVGKGLPHPHSYAFARLMSSFESSLSSVYQINDTVDFLRIPAYGRLNATVDFIKNAIIAADQYATKPSKFRISDDKRAGVFDAIADLIFRTILAASAVTSPVWTAWSTQHNMVWSRILGPSNSTAHKVVAFKVRRFLYEEIIRMNRFANFKGARILGYCLNVLGLTLTDRYKGSERNFYPLQAAVLGWTKANYRRLVTDHPRVADACLQGSVAYEPAIKGLSKPTQETWVRNLPAST